MTVIDDWYTTSTGLEVVLEEFVPVDTNLQNKNLVGCDEGTPVG